MKKVVLGAIIFCALFLTTVSSLAEAKQQQVRNWNYLQVTGLISPHWAVSVMPGIRWEFYDSKDSAGEVVMYEFFAGPIYIQKFGNFTLKVPLWYYYMGFPINRPGEKDDYFDSHNLELIPILEYKIGRWTFQSRTILHNKLYARNSVFQTEKQRRGYSLLWRQLFRASYGVLPNLDITIAEEFFIGVVEDRETNGLVKGEPFFEKRGLSMNRIYLGVDAKLGKGFSLCPQYIFETSHDPDHDNEVTRMTHYLFLSLQYVFRLF